MKYSILVPVYNVEAYLEQCVESMLAQTYTDFEIILVNDGSTDNSGEICNRYALEYPDKIKVIHKKNEGHTSARQVGIGNASGDVCIFVDSDDFIEPRLIEMVNDAFLTEPDTDIVMYSFSYFDKNGKMERKQTLSDTDKTYTAENKEILYKALINTPLISSLCTKAIKTDILKNDTTNYKEYYDKKMGEDWFCSIYFISVAKKVKYINKAFYNYRIDNQSITRSFSPETISKKNMIYVYDRFIEFLPQWGIDSDESVKKLNARWLSETIYTFSQYYKAAKTNAQRKAVVDFDWKSMLPEDIFANDNEFESSVNKQIFSWIENKKYFAIRWYFFKIQCYKKFKEIKKLDRKNK